MQRVPTTLQAMQDIMDAADERLFWEVVRHHERPPYFFENEGVGNRLARAARVVLEDRLVPNSDGSYTVTGSENRQYRVTERCSCPQAQRGKSHWCYHHIAVVLYVEWQRRLHPATAHTPEEALMPADDSQFIPEPDHVSTATVEPTNPVSVLTPVAPLLDDLEQALQVWTTQRAVVQRFLKQELKPGIDYYTLRLGGKDSKPSLSKAGAEKVMGWLKIQASFTPDTGTWEMLGRPLDLVAYVCTLRTRSGEIVGEGRGARSLKKDNGDINKAIKMAEKSACISAVLRTGALSDVFTQDIEDMDEKEPAPQAPVRPSASDLRARIWSLVKAADATITTRAACEAYVQRTTGLALEPEQYPAILARLEESW